MRQDERGVRDSSRLPFWRPGEAAPPGSSTGAPGRRAEATNESVDRLDEDVIVFRSHKRGLALQQEVVLVVGETGCGKSTQIPQYLLEANWAAEPRCIACAQPRRLAATTLAQRVAEESGSSLGGKVGYAVRFDHRFSDEQTRIKFLTDGMLVRETLSDPLLSKYSVVVVDEAHERSVDTDVLLSILRKIARKRDIRIVVASATLNVDTFRNFFATLRHPSPPILAVQGRVFPVDSYFLSSPARDYVQATARSAAALAQSGTRGVLAFLTGREECESAAQLFAESVGSDVKAECLVLYAGVSAAAQERLFRTPPDGVCRVVMSTNVAETSVTIPFISAVIDCGFVKVREYDADANAEVLHVVPVSQAQALQRAGRAGRTAPGACYRLYTRAVYDELQADTAPEIIRTDLSRAVMHLKSLGIDNIVRHKFVTPPDPAQLARSLEVLYALGGIDKAGVLTHNVGRPLSELAIPPMLGAVLLAGVQCGCAQEALSAVAMILVQFPFADTVAGERAVAKFGASEGDHVTLLNVYRAYLGRRMSREWCQRNGIRRRVLQRAVQIREQLERQLSCLGFAVDSSCADNAQLLSRAFCAGLFLNAARLQSDGSYRLIRSNRTVFIHPSSVMVAAPAPCVVYGEIVRASKTYIRDVIAVEQEWLTEFGGLVYDVRVQQASKRARADA